MTSSTLLDFHQYRWKIFMIFHSSDEDLQQKVDPCMFDWIKVRVRWCPSFVDMCACWCLRLRARENGGHLRGTGPRAWGPSSWPPSYLIQSNGTEYSTPAHVCLIGFRWGSIGEGSTVGPTLVDPSPMDPHRNPIKHTWASTPTGEWIMRRDEPTEGRRGVRRCGFRHVERRRFRHVEGGGRRRGDGGRRRGETGRRHPIRRWVGHRHGGWRGQGDWNQLVGLF